MRYLSLHLRNLRFISVFMLLSSKRILAGLLASSVGEATGFSDILLDMIDFQKPNSARRVWIARAVAIAADVVQVGIFPASIQGAISPVDDGLDLIVAVILTLLVGWHIAFLPSFIVKLVPIADLAPTWTIAVLIATRGATSKPEPLKLP
jgi:hypothetical protein